MQNTTPKGVAYGSIIAALLTLYQFLPSFGLHVPTLPTDFGPAIGTVIGFIVGLFTKNPTVVSDPPIVTK